jgi:hypothetical protein
LLAKAAVWFAGVIIVALIGAFATVVVRTLQPPEEISAKLSRVLIDHTTYSTWQTLKPPTMDCDRSPCGEDSVRNLRGPLDETFKGARERRVRGSASRREFVGVTVNFNITMTGLRGDTADVRWSLHRARRDASLPSAWRDSRSVFLPHSAATKDTGSGQFWVPLPREKGPFFIRIEVYSEAGGRLDYADTRRFN